MNYPQALPILLENGYAPAAIGPHARSPAGPWAKYQPSYRIAGDPDYHAAVLAAVPPAHGPGERVIEHPQLTYLSVVSVQVRPELLADVDRILGDFAGDAQVLVRVDGPGRLVCLCANDGTIPFAPLRTEHYHGAETHARVESAAAFAAITGDWRKGDSPLTVPRAALAALGRERARELLNRLNQLFDARQPPPSAAPRAVRTIKLPPMAKVTWVPDVLDRLRENGYSLAPITAGREPSHDRRWNRVWTDEDGSPDDQVGLLTSLCDETQVAAVHVRTQVPEALEMLADRFSGAPVRVASDGTRTYVLRTAGQWRNSQRALLSKDKAGNPVPDAGASITVDAFNTVVLLTGGRWNGSLLETKRQDLPQLMDVEGLLSTLEHVLLERASAA